MLLFFVVAIIVSAVVVMYHTSCVMLSSAECSPFCLKNIFSALPTDICTAV